MIRGWLLSALVVGVAVFCGLGAVTGVASALAPHGRAGASLQCLRAAGEHGITTRVAVPEALQAHGEWTFWPLGLDCTWTAPGLPAVHRVLPDWPDTGEAIACGLTALSAPVLAGTAVRRRRVREDHGDPLRRITQLSR